MYNYSKILKLMGHATLVKVLIAIALAVVAGKLTGTTADVAGITFYQIYSLVGQLFLNALYLVVVPLVSASIITGTARLGGEKSFKELGLLTFGFFLGTTALAIIIGWVLVTLIQPGTFSAPIPLGLEPSALDLAARANEGTFAKIEQILLKIVPSNIIATASQGQMLGLIFFCLVFGFFLSKIEKEPSGVLYNFWKGIFEVMMKMTQLVMKALPIGVFALVAKTIASTGFESIASVGYFFLTVLLGLAIFILGLLGLLKLIANVNPFKHMKAMAPALITAFSTSSSAATLPVTIECMEKEVGVSNRITGFTLPLATSVNLAGSSLQVMVAVLMIAQSYHIPLSGATQMLVFLLTLLLSIGMAGIPSASLISIMLILSSIGLPADGIALILAVERLLDMCRTAVNVFSNSCCTVFIAKQQGEKLKI